MRAKWLLRLAKGAASDVLTGSVWEQHRGPSELPCVTVQPFDQVAFSVPLVTDAGIVSIDDDGTVWATTGLYLYRFDPDHDVVRRESSLPVPDALGALLRSRSLRLHLRLEDVTQTVNLQSGAQLLRSLGWLYRRDASESQYRPVHRLERFGAKYGRGLLARGIVQLSSGRILYGEYFSNPERIAVRIFASDDDGRTWEPTFTFPAGQIRHIHALVEDPFTGDVYACAGDADEESRIVRSSDGGRSFEVLGSGSQSWRTCNLLFTEHAIFWGGDSALFLPAIYRYDRSSGALEQLQKVDGAIEDGVRLNNGLMIFGTCRGGYPTEWDANPSLWIGGSDREWVRCRFGLRRGSFRGHAATRLVTSPNGQHVGIVMKNVSQFGYASIWTTAASLATLAQQEPCNARSE